MLRRLLVGLAIVALTACAYRSEIDLAPLAERTPQAVAPSGDYCEATASSPPYQVKSSEGCARIVWDQASRTYLMMSDEQGEEPTRLAPISLGDDLFLLQGDGGADSGAGRYHLVLVVAKGAAFFMIPTLDQKALRAVAARHPGVTLAGDDGKDPVISGGDPGAIRNFMKDVARKALQGADLEDKELSIAIRDRAGAPDHDANGLQTMSIIDLVTALFALQEQD